MCFELSAPLQVSLKSVMSFLGCVTTREPLPVTFNPRETRVPVKLNDAITAASCQQQVQNGALRVKSCVVALCECVLPRKKICLN